MEPSDQDWRWLYGAFLCIVAAAVIGHDFIANCSVSPPGEGQLSPGWCAEAWFNRYQTLVAGALAFLGALLTVQGIKAQIKQASDVEKYRREREEIAARAKLLMALNVLSNYAETCIRELASLRAVNFTGHPRINGSSLN
jgi:hypothetical protein